MIAINDNYADGRDMSWLWDVDFESLQARYLACHRHTRIRHGAYGCNTTK